MKIIHTEWFPGIIILLAFIIFIVLTSFIKGDLNSASSAVTGTGNKTSGAGTLSVDITGLKNKKGKVIVSIYKKLPFSNSQNIVSSGNTGFTKENIAVDFSNLAPGEYAVLVFHDENQNNVPDVDSQGIPVEGIGMSNIVKPHPGGSPEFDEVKLRLGTDDIKVTVPVFYYQELIPDK